jgi:hypothetical protein
MNSSFKFIYKLEPISDGIPGGFDVKAKVGKPLL